MAYRNFDFIQALQRKMKIINGSFAPNGLLEIDADSLKGKGFSVSRVDGGVYQIQFEDNYKAVVSANCQLQLASADDKYVMFQGAMSFGAGGAKTAKIAVWDKSATDQPEITTVQCVADVAGSLGGKYFTINAANDLVKYYVWFNVDGASTDPAPAGLTGVEVAISENDVADDVATAVAAALDALSAFGAAAVTDTVTVTNAANGVTTDAADVDAGVTINVTQQGDAHLKDPAANANNRIHFKFYFANTEL